MPAKSGYGSSGISSCGLGTQTVGEGAGGFGIGWKYDCMSEAPALVLTGQHWSQKQSITLLLTFFLVLHLLCCCLVPPSCSVVWSCLSACCIPRPYLALLSFIPFSQSSIVPSHMVWVSSRTLAPSLLGNEDSQSALHPQVRKILLLIPHCNRNCL
jgi:hypothetical protein